MRSIAVVLAVSLTAVAGADVITQWNFNGPSSTTVPGGELSPTASTGFGTASLTGGVTAAAAFGSGAANGGSSDPAGGAPPNYAWQTTSYAAQGAENGLRGVQFNVSTVGYDAITVNWDQRHSNTSSRWVQFLYSLDGTTFTAAGLAGGGIFEAGLGGDTWYNVRAVDLSSISGAGNNANFAFRVVATFAPGTSGYAASTSTSTYAGSGTWRFDMVTVNGAVPAPGALALLGLAGVISRRRR